MNPNSTLKTIGKSVLSLSLMAVLLLLFKTGNNSIAAAQNAAANALDESSGYLIYQPLIEKNAEVLSDADLYKRHLPTRTPYPTRTPMATKTPTPTRTPTRTPTITPTPRPTVPNPGLGYVPYGVFHNSNYDRTFFNASIISGNEWRELDDMRAEGQHALGAASISDPCYYMPNGPDNFDVDQMVNDIVARRDDILDYASDGTLLGLLELNEPHDPNCEEKGGQAGWQVPQSALYEVASRFWQEFPELTPNDFYFGFSTSPIYIEDGGGTTDINLAFIQYVGKPGETVQSWAAPYQASAIRQGMRLIYSANLYFLGADAAVAANTWECQQTDAVMVTVWNDSFVHDADGPTFAEAKAVCDANSP